MITINIWLFSFIMFSLIGGYIYIQKAAINRFDYINTFGKKLLFLIITIVMLPFEIFILLFDAIFRKEEIIFIEEEREEENDKRD